MAELAVNAEKVVVAFGDHVAVNGVSLKIKPGEFYTLLGTNGAGKTSLLETVEGLRSPKSGSVEVLGGDPGASAIRTRMGIMLQESGYAADLTVAETIQLLGSLSGRQDDVDAVIRQVGLEDSARTRAAHLSGGEKRRLDLATAIYGRPKLLFLDEPSTGLDPEARDALWASVRSLSADGTTVILTTHYLEEAEAYSDRIGIMHSGYLAVEGTLTELAEHSPATIRFRASRELWDSLPINAQWIEGIAVIATHTLQQDLTALLGWADRHSILLEALSASPPGLRELVRGVAEGDIRV